MTWWNLENVSAAEKLARGDASLCPVISGGWKKQPLPLVHSGSMKLLSALILLSSCILPLSSFAAQPNLIWINPLFPALRSAPTAVSGASRQKQIPSSQPVTNMTITGNDFARTSTTPLIIHNVDGLKIKGNSIDYPADAGTLESLDNSSQVNWLYLQDCNSLSLQGNLTPIGK